MPGVGTWPNINLVDPSRVEYTLYLIDASGDRWTEKLITALTATLAAVQAWLVLYQTVSQASLWRVDRAEIWEGAMETGNAQFGARFEVKNGINLAYRDGTTLELDTIRVVSPTTPTMQGTTDVPVPNLAPLSDLVVATSGIKPGFGFQTAQYTIHRERRGNPRVS